MALIKSVSGIRGIVGGKVGNSLTPVDTVEIVAGYGTWIKSIPSDGPFRVVLGRDARISGEIYENLVASTLQALGIDVISLGLCTTPTVEMAVLMENASGGIILSASHNPKEWNALKLVNSSGEVLLESQMKAILDLSKNENFSFVDIYHLGRLERKKDYIEKHIKAILSLYTVDKEAIEGSNFKIVVDAVNSTGGVAVPMLLRALGVKEIIELDCVPNGQFTRNPEPLEEHLEELCKEVVNRGADMGIAVDPDVDRLALVCEEGSVFGEEYTLVAIADYIVEKKRGPVVSNLSSSSALRDLALEKGVSYYSSKVGETHVIEKMKQTAAVIGGEGNGGVIYPELHYGRDALVGIALFLTHMAYFKEPMSKLKKKYPTYYISKKKLKFPADLNTDKLFEILKCQFENHEIDSRDGIKIFFKETNEWVHLRKSNTESIIRLYAESASKKKAADLGKNFSNKIESILKKM